jgi:coatomer protein complex subunit gamma
MSGFRDGKKDEDSEEQSPFGGVDKSTLLQEVRCFNDAQLNSRKCCTVITKLLYLLSQGEKFTSTESTEVFFSVTKLFQSKETMLRRMVYLVIKALTASAEEVIIVTSCLTRDMHSKNDLYRANAIRVLCSITDASMMAQIERFLKQAIVDKQPFVASAALVSGLHLMHTNPEVVKRWQNEVNQAVMDKQSTMVQYHALALLHEIKQNDRLAVSKLVSQLCKSQLQSPLAQCLLIRYAVRVIEDGADAAQERQSYDFLESCLRHKNDMVIFEAARAICNLRNVTPRELTPAITVLQLFLNSQKPVLRFASARALNKVAVNHPLSVSACNLDLESLISDSNRSIATLAITTLLKTGSEFSVDRLMKQISSFMADIADEFKIVVVDAIRSLCLKYSQKHRLLMSFLSNILREEGGYEYKKAIVDSILLLIKEIPEAMEPGLSHLCEFIEDCEFTVLSVQILFLLGKEGPKTTNPAKFIRYIYNRVILENATVRAAAVTALAKFGAACPKLRESTMTLLRRCLHDNDDEVRDRATFFLAVLESESEMTRWAASSSLPSIHHLEKTLGDYANFARFEVPFDFLKAVSETPVTAAEAKAAAATTTAALNAASSAPARAGGGAEPGQDTTTKMQQELINKLPQMAHVGKLFKACRPVELTEQESEYLVNVVKLVCPEHVLLQFNITNTIKDQALSDCVVKLDLSQVEGLIEEASVAATLLVFEVPGQSWVCLRRDLDAGFPTGSIGCTLVFTAKEVDPATGEPDEEGYEDEYQLEEVEISTADYVHRVTVADFGRSWDVIGDTHEVMEAYSLTTLKTLQDAVNAIIEFMGMQTLDGTHNVPSSAKSHRVLLCGLFMGSQVLVRADIVLDPSGGVNMQLAIRSERDDVSQAIAASVA